MYDKWTTSLCAVVIYDGRGSLFRVADVAEGRLEPYELDKERDIDDFNRDRIHHPSATIPEEGNLALWRWSSNNSWQESVLEKKQRWIEYVQYDDVFSLDGLKKRLLEGVDVSPIGRNFLFAYERMADGQCACLFIRGTDFTPGSDSKVVLKDSVFFLDVCSVCAGDIAKVAICKSPSYSVSYYKSLAPPVSESSVALRPTDAIVKQIILSRITSYIPKNLGRKGKDTIRDFLGFIADSTLADDIAAKCHCSTEIANTYLKVFIDSCESYLSCEDFDARLLARLVDSDLELTQRLRGLVQAAWEQDNAQKINDAETALTNLLEQCTELEIQRNSLSAACTELSSSKTELEGAVQALQQQYDLQLGDADGIAEQVRTKIADAQNDIAGFFAQHAIYTAHTALSPEASATKNQVHLGKKVSDSPEHLKGNRELIDALRENLDIVGVAQDKTLALAAYLLAAHAARTPLVIAGYGAAQLLDALSATLSNKTATIVYQPQNQEAEIVCRLPSTDVVVLCEAFQCTALSRILSTHASPYVCLIAATSEELSIEPKSFYNYALPVFTEFFIDSAMDGELEGSRSSLKLPIRAHSRLLSLPENSLPLLAMNRCKELLGTASAIANTNLTAYEAFLLQTIPVMLSLGKRTELLDLISDSACTDQEKKQMRRLVGDNND